MQAGLLSPLPISRLTSMYQQVEASASTATTSDSADLLSQCTTEWSRYFISSRIAPCSSGKYTYTAALTADLQSQPERPRQRVPSRTHRRHPSPPTPSPCPPPEPASFAAEVEDTADSSGDSGRGSEADGDSPAESSGSPTPQNCTSGSDTAIERLRKRVQFADEVGQALTRVKLLSVSEPDNRLPLLVLAENHDFSQRLHQQAQWDSNEPWLRCKFSQPSAKYVVFRESLERNLVSLSFVHLEPDTIRGSIAVKNVSFRKRVFVHVSFDSWNSFKDVEATYNGSDGQQDNFSFSLPCPPDQQADIQFCVCFECDCGTFWDNNGGENYRIGVVPAAPAGSGYTRDFKPDYGGVAEFSEFSAWDHFDDQVYY
ncbi:hypothetical protein BOX15_Mlig031228g1 [Macrostomum lignano]|uniref:CBM21 domain-containing protein n=2 Tax=Macrostomum lignano TaxID=282301 RepID=A0A1I8FVA4_9PLAT|nr:hypothetical protein BOX15_Mlig031228g1 [Macrostomum lignano]